MCYCCIIKRKRDLSFIDWLWNIFDLIYQQVLAAVQVQSDNFFKQYEVSFMETSAKTGQNVELAFMAVAR